MIVWCLKPILCLKPMRILKLLPRRSPQMALFLPKGRTQWSWLTTKIWSWSLFAGLSWYHPLVPDRNMTIMCSRDHLCRSLSQDCQDFQVLLHLLDLSVSIASKRTTPSLTVIRIPTRSQGSPQIASGATNSATTTLVFSTTKRESSLTCTLIVKLWLGSPVLKKL